MSDQENRPAWKKILISPKPEPAWKWALLATFLIAVFALFLAVKEQMRADGQAEFNRRVEEIHGKQIPELWEE